MFVAHDLGHGLRVHPLERFEALAAAGDRDAIHECRGLVFAERIDEHLAHEVLAADTHARSGFSTLELKSPSTADTSSRETLARSAMALPSCCTSLAPMCRRISAASVSPSVSSRMAARSTPERLGAGGAAGFFAAAGLAARLSRRPCRAGRRAFLRGGFSHRSTPRSSRPARPVSDPARRGRAPARPVVRRRGSGLRHRRRRRRLPPPLTALSSCGCCRACVSRPLVSGFSTLKMMTKQHDRRRRAAWRDPAPRPSPRTAWSRARLRGWRPRRRTRS